MLDETLEERAGTFAEIPATLHPSLSSLLRSRGMTRLYSHQARAFDLARNAQDVVVATPTASGKSLCYHLPVLDRLARRSGARALYLFPTKSLARDQEEGLRSWMRDAGLEHGVVTYDGDTPGDARRAARERAGVLFTNPDMLHAGILPHHTGWARMFADLEFVVVDELHTYRGVFGSHLANVLRRLIRIARFHGSNPTFIFTSATIKNPREHASRLVGREVELVDECGAPAGTRRVLVYNPPVVNAELGIRASCAKSAVRLVGDLVVADVPTLLFGQSRNQVEVMLKYLRDRLIDEGLDPKIVQGYRGGYLPETRRRIEAGLRAQQIRCVVATSALELGLDIGCLDAVVCAGYPGTIAGLWQRFGRAGRRMSGSLAVLVTSSSPLDQYLARDPKTLVDMAVEEARVDPDNIEILLKHVRCAAFELPFESGEAFSDVPAEALEGALEFLAENRVLQPVRSSTSGRTLYHWASDVYPASSVSLRSASFDNVVIIDVETQLTLAEMDYHSAHTMLHEQAIYQQEGEQYQVERFDRENHKAFVRKVAPDYYTTAMTNTKVLVLYEEASAHFARSTAELTLRAGLGEVTVIEKVIGYKKIKFHTHENVGYGEVQLPEIEMPSTAIWVIFPAGMFSRDVPRSITVDALRGLAHAMHTVASIGLMMDPRDLGVAVVDTTERSGSEPSGGSNFDPTIYLYDHVAGGVGLAPRLYEDRQQLLCRAFDLIANCACEQGCPGCVGPVAPFALDEHSDWSRKRVAIDLGSRLSLVSTT